MNAKYKMLTIPALVWSAMAGMAVGDVRVNYEVEGGGEALESIQIRDGWIRMDQAGETQWTLFDSSEQAMYMIDDTRREYYRLDAEVLSRLGDLGSMIDRQMEEALADVPPAQREQMRQMMQGMMSGAMEQARASMPEQTVRQTGVTRSVAGYNCEVAEILIDGRRVMETCGVAAEALSLPADDLATIRALQQFAAELAAQVEHFLGEGFMDLGELGLDQFPVETRQYDNDDKVTVTRLDSVDTNTLDASLFRIPDDYRQQEIEQPEL